MDCTYKTNKYKMPLLTICGVTFLGTTFIVGFAFIEKETTKYYDWVLYQLNRLYISLGLPRPRVIATDRDLALMEAIATRFPTYPTIHSEGTRHVLCLWHLHRNVAKNCKAFFAIDEEWEAFLAAWHAIIYADTQADFKTAWIRLVTDYHESHREDVDYVATIWLKPWMDRLCKYHTNELRHYGITTTSRAEGIHRVLKTNLQFSTGDLVTVIDRIEVMLMNQLKKYRKDIGKAQRSTPYDFHYTIFRNLIGCVTPHALWMIYAQFQRLTRATKDDSLSTCTEVFTKTMGLPCSYAIKARMEAVKDGLGRILMDDVDPHWCFKKPHSGLEPTVDFTSDIQAIEEALAEPLGLVDDDEDAEEALPSIDDIIRGIQTNNVLERPASDSSEPAAKLIDEDVDLLDVNEPRVVKSKGRPTGARNKKGTMTRTEKAKAKSTKRDPSGFEHVDAAIKASRGGKRTVGRGGRGGRGKAIKNKQKEPEIDDIAAMDAHIQAFNQDMDEIHEDIRGIITRQAARKEAKGATATFAASAAPTAFAIIKTTINEVIQVSDDDAFDADNGGDADSDDDWMYDRGD
jgi:hypothetical protein